MTLRFTPRALVDLDAMRADGDMRWGETRTTEFLDGFVTAIERLDAFPDMGRRRDALLPSLRSILHRGCVVFYRKQDDDVVIGPVLHERRNHAALDFADAFEVGGPDALG